MEKGLLCAVVSYPPTYYMRRVIKPDVWLRYNIFIKHHGAMINHDLRTMLLKQFLSEDVVYSVHFIRGWKQTEQLPELDNMLLQDLAIAQWFPKRRPGKGVTFGKNRAFIYQATDETMDLSKRFFNQIYDEEHYWMDQCQVANWAILGLEEEWSVYCLYDGYNKVPLYYVIIASGRDNHSLHMKGIWKSLYGTLKYKALNMKFPKGKAFYLLKQVVSYWNLADDAMVHVQLRQGLKSMLNNHGVNVHHIGKIPKTQGASVSGQFSANKLKEAQ